MAKFSDLSSQFFDIPGVDVISIISLSSHLIDIVGNNSHTVQQGRKLFQVHNIQLGVEGAVPNERISFHIAGIGSTLDLRPLLQIKRDLFLFYDLVLSRYNYHPFIFANYVYAPSDEGFGLGWRVP